MSIDPCSKVSFATAAAARRYLQLLRRRVRNRRMRIYRCQYCGLWHTTKEGADPLTRQKRLAGS